MTEHKEYKHTTETKNKIRQGNIGKHLQKGKNNTFYGKKHSEETKDKIRKSKYHSNLKGENNPNYGNHILKGRKMPDEQRKKISETHSGKNNPFYGKKHTKETIEKIKNANHIHHIYLKENSEEILTLPMSKHRQLHARAYDYLYYKYGKKAIDEYLKWFAEKYGLD